MASIVDICNKALSLIGQANIVSLEDDSTEAYACNTHWSGIQKEILAGHPWNCVTQTVVLNRLTDTPPNEFKYYYQLPTGYLRMNKIFPDQDYQVQGKRVLADTEDLIIDCVIVTDNTDIYQPELVSALAYALASELAYPMTKSVSLADRMSKLANDKLHDAKASNAFEGKRRNNNSTNWLKAKYG